MTDAAIERVYNKYSRIKHTQDSSDLKASDKKQDCISERQRVLLEVNEGVIETSWIGCFSRVREIGVSSQQYSGTWLSNNSVHELNCPGCRVITRLLNKRQYHTSSRLSLSDCVSVRTFFFNQGTSESNTQKSKC